MVKEKSMSQPDDYWKNRTLCSDDTCIGVIGPDGRCKECGKKFEGELPAPAVLAEEEEKSSAVPEIEPENISDAQTRTESRAPETPGSSAESDWENRRLCSDENCIGVIGPDSRCKECGKPFAES